MAFCSKCGAEVEEGAKFCAICGEALEPQNTADSVADTVKEKFNEFNNTADTTNEYDPADIENNKLMALLSYIWILVLVPLFAAKDSKFARFHANQGLLLLIAELIVGLAVGIISSIVSLVLGLIGLGVIAVAAVGIVGAAVGIVSLIYLVLGIYNCVTGKAKELPFIGKFRILK